MWITFAIISLLAGIVLGLMLGEAYRRRGDRKLQPVGRVIDLGGRRMHLIAKGSGVPVVLITGGGEPALILAPLQDRIGAFARALAYDRPGYGWSDAAPARGFDDHARDLHDLLKRANERGPFVLVGESLGGLIARAFAGLFPADVAGVVLVDAAEEEHIFAHLHALRSAARQQLAMVRLLLPLGLVRYAVTRALGPRYPIDRRPHLVAALSRTAHWRAAKNELRAYDLTPAGARAAGGFGRVDQPLTVIAHGRPFRGANAALEDGWRAGQERLASLSPASRLVVAERCGHAIAQEDPDLAASEVRRLIEREAPVRADGEMA